jgi:hypothetical protein
MLHEAEIVLPQGAPNAETCRVVSCRGIVLSDQTYYRWRKEYGRYGYLHLKAFRRSAKWTVNRKRDERLWRREGTVKANGPA